MIRHLSTASTIARAAGILLAIGYGMPGNGQTGAEDLRLTVGKSIVIDYPGDVRQISTSNPEVVDANPVTTREVLVHGKGMGTATLIVWSRSGERTFYTVTVELNLDPLRRLLSETFPGEDIHVQSSRDAISLTGHISTAQVGERAAALAAPFAKTVVNNLSPAIAPVDKQIVLRVKFADLDRQKATQYGVNIMSLGAGNTVGRITTGQFPSGSLDITGGQRNLTISDALSIFAFRPDLNLAGFIKALQLENVLQILAEPNLVTTNGKEASFLVGGEFPVPVIQGGSNAGSITVQFREFGIRLLFTPIITPNKTIKLHLRQEVSTIDLTNAVTLNGFTIPALATRRAETDIELAEGQSFVVAGLLDNRETETFSKVPGLGDVPILGELFKSKELKRSRTELVMLVTPEMAKPIEAGEKLPLPYFPGDFLVRVDPQKTAEAKPPATDPAPAAKGGSRKHWYSLSRSGKQ